MGKRKPRDKKRRTSGRQPTKPVIIPWRRRVGSLLDTLLAWARSRYEPAIQAHLKSVFGDPPAAERIGLDFDFILAALRLDFVSQASLGNVLRVMVWPTRLGRRSFDFAYRIVNVADGREVLRATSVQVTYDYDDRRSCPVPSAMADGLRRELERCAPLLAEEPG